MPSKWTPRLGAVSRVLKAWAEVSRVLDGTQSHSTQAPPSPSSLTTVTSAPRSAATRAASYPPGPPPTMITRIGRWYPVRGPWAQTIGSRSADPSEGGHQGDEHPEGKAQADQVDAAGPGGTDAEGRQQEADERGQVQEEHERVGHVATPSGFGEPEQAHLTQTECGLTSAKPPTPRAQGSEGVGRAIGAELGPEGVADLADGGQVAEGLAHRGEEVVAAAGGVAQVGQGGLDGLAVAGGAEVDQGLGLGVGDGRVELHGGDRLLLAAGVAVDADHHPLAPLDGAELVVGRALDLLLLEAALDRRHRAAELLDPGHQPPGRGLDLIGQALHEVGPS